MSLNNMKAEMKRVGVTQCDVADSMGMSNNNLNLKINEKIPMTVDEAKFIRDNWLPDCTLDVLLQSDGDVPTKAESLHEQVNAMTDAMRHATNPDDPEIAKIGDMFHECVNEWERQYSKPAT